MKGWLYVLAGALIVCALWFGVDVKHVPLTPKVVTQAAKAVEPIPPAPDTVVKFIERIRYVAKEPDRTEVSPFAAAREVQEFCAAGGYLVQTDTVSLRDPNIQVVSSQPAFITGGRYDDKKLALYGINAMGDSIATIYSGVYAPFQFARLGGSNFHVQSSRWGRVWSVLDDIAPVVAFGLGYYTADKITH